MGEEVVIDDSNFDEYFRDTRQNTPKEGEIVACYTAIAEFVRGPEKQHMIDLLRNTEKAVPGTQVMKKLLYACEKDSFGVPLQMAKDMLSGMTVDEILDKPYKYKVEIFYYTKPEHVPVDDPHWSTISLMNLDDYLSFTVKDKEGTEFEVRTKMLIDD